MKKLLFSGLFLSLSCFFLFNGCQSNTNTKESGDHFEEGISDDDLHITTVSNIELNNGEKWLVNEEMKPFVLKGAKIVSDFIREGSTDFDNLATMITDQNNQLIKSCTMEGESHEELHQWLHPHLELVNTLKEEGDKEKAKGLVLQLRDSYTLYDQYFQ